jgi:hypothetical protein
VPALEGTIQITGLPPNRGLIISLCFFGVETAETPAPYNGDPPVEAVTDCDQVYEQVDFNREWADNTFEHDFRVERKVGYYFVQLRVVLLRSQAGKMLAQAEQFFFGRRPLRIPVEPNANVTFPVAWPTQPLSELHAYGQVIPQRRRPWWRFW